MVYTVQPTGATSEFAYSASSSSYLEDIVGITCLVLRDGEEHRFIHKTVQEYYAASYIQKKPEPWAIALYGRILNRLAHTTWAQELAFLSEIDKYRYEKYYILPAIIAFLNLKEEDLIDPKSDTWRLDSDRIFGAVTLHFKPDDFSTIGIQHVSHNNFLGFRMIELMLPYLSSPGMEFQHAVGELKEDDEIKSPPNDFWRHQVHSGSTRSPSEAQRGKGLS